MTITVEINTNYIPMLQFSYQERIMFVTQIKGELICGFAWFAEDPRNKIPFRQRRDLFVTRYVKSPVQ